MPGFHEGAEATPSTVFRMVAQVMLSHGHWQVAGVRPGSGGGSSSDESGSESAGVQAGQGTDGQLFWLGVVVTAWSKADANGITDSDGCWVVDGGMMYIMVR